MRGFGNLPDMGDPDDILERFGNRVHELRKSEGYSQETTASARRPRPNLGGESIR